MATLAKSAGSLVLKTFVIDAALKDHKTHPEPLKEGKGGYFVCLDVVDNNDKIPSPDHKFRTKLTRSYTEGWKQSCAITCDADKISTYRALKVALWKGIPSKKSEKQIITTPIGSCPDILFSSIPENGKLDQAFNVLNNGEFIGTLKLVVAWYKVAPPRPTQQTQPGQPPITRAPSGHLPGRQATPAIPVAGAGANKFPAPAGPGGTPGTPGGGNKFPTPTGTPPLSSSASARRPTLMSDPEKARQSAMASVCKAKEAEVAQLKKNLVMLQTQTAEENVKRQKMIKLLHRYRDVDEDARELIGGGVDWAKVREQERHEIRLKTVGVAVNPVKDDTPRAWADFILLNENLNHVDSIQQKLLTCDSKWVKEFVDHDAIPNIYTMLHLLEEKRLEVDMSKKEANLAALLITMMNSQSVIEHITKVHHQMLTDILSLILGSPNNLMKTRMFWFFAALAIYGRVANKLVQEATNNYEIKDIEKRKATQAFHLLCRTIRIETDGELLTSSISLINGLIAGEKVLSERMRLRALFVQYLGRTFAKQRLAFASNLPLIKQLDAFNDMEARDNKELTELRFIGKFNLTDPRALFTQIAGQAEALGVGDLFLRHMQQLMLIPYLNSNPHTFWRFIEHASRHLTSKRTNGRLLTDNTIFYSEQSRLLQQSKMKEALDQINMEKKKQEAAVEAAAQAMASGGAPPLPAQPPTPTTVYYGIHGQPISTPTPLVQGMIPAPKIDRPRKPGKAAPQAPPPALTGSPSDPPAPPTGLPRGGPPPPGARGGARGPPPPPTGGVAPTTAKPEKAVTPVEEPEDAGPKDLSALEDEFSKMFADDPFDFPGGGAEYNPSNPTSFTSSPGLTYEPPKPGAPKKEKSSTSSSSKIKSN